MTKPFILSEPREWTSPAVFSSPHSGTAYPADFLASADLDPMMIRSSEDAFVDRLYAAAPDHGAPLLAATLPRAYVDVNRAADELDPALIAGAQRRCANPRVSAGLGVIPRVVAEGRPIRQGKIPLREALKRLRLGYHPYHEQLEALLSRQRDTFGVALLFDCHSMPHDALCSAPMVRGRRPDVVLGDRFGAACARWVIEAAAELFTAQGFVVARNAPFAGGYITQHYGRPSRNMHALQIEIDRALYMDERRLVPNDRFEDVAARLSAILAQMARLGDAATPLAAE
ncbi:N-formylglutamate amidohydrolase [Halovulum dunhuangense]|uniref:N-formylglutamate amidohydrolase n=1 Tax=Halovulum dunhuangense TaxID=1505036 RepID=A0A849KYP1_9RHOB|nr:N-formylglutamate amidohydrolase [Halovulum dunhuangense]